MIALHYKLADLIKDYMANILEIPVISVSPIFHCSKGFFHGTNLIVTPVIIYYEIITTDHLLFSERLKIMNYAKGFPNNPVISFATTTILDRL